MIRWHHTPRGAAYLARLSPDRIGLKRDAWAIGGAAYLLSYPEELDALRSECVAEQAGGSFLELEASGHLDDWRAANAGQPGVQEVLADMFGSPALVTNMDIESAEKQWRAAAHARIALGRRAA